MNEENDREGRDVLRQQNTQHVAQFGDEEIWAAICKMESRLSYTKYLLKLGRH